MGACKENEDSNGGTLSTISGKLDGKYIVV